MWGLKCTLDEKGGEWVLSSGLVKYFSLCSPRSVLNQPTSYRPRLLLAGRPGSGQSSHLAPAVLHALEKFTVYTLDMAVLFGVSTTSPEEACAQVLYSPLDHTLLCIVHY